MQIPPIYLYIMMIFDIYYTLICQHKCVQKESLKDETMNFSINPLSFYCHKNIYV